VAKTIEDKLDVVAGAVTELYHTISNLPVPVTSVQAKDDAKIDIVRIRAQLDDIRDQITAERSSGKQ
jgi:hypothetical protein